jgi:hypothetical protein
LSRGELVVLRATRGNFSGERDYRSGREVMKVPVNAGIPALRRELERTPGEVAVSGRAGGWEQSQPYPYTNSTKGGRR